MVIFFHHGMFLLDLVPFLLLVGVSSYPQQQTTKNFLSIMDHAWTKNIKKSMVNISHVFFLRDFVTLIVISPQKKILTTKTHVSRVTSLRRIIGEGSRVGHGDGSRVPLKKLERDEPMCFFGGCYRSPRQSLDSRGPVFFSSELRYLPSKERANISSLKGKRNTSSNRLKSANWEGRWDIFLEGRSDCEESQYLFDA